ncbi:hypothetical protein [Bacillus infantis]|uniref:hypothetical protein n=1 Tax=Bacillus infantis TaxID=324767 RepID=UPI003CEF2C22
MKNKKISILITLLYCFPFVFFAMYQDFSFRPLLGYSIMVIGTCLLAFFSRLNQSLIPFIAGNIASFAISFYFTIGMAGNDRWQSYTKPLEPYQALILFTCLNLILQLVGIWAGKRYSSKVRT